MAWKYNRTVSKSPGAKKGREKKDTVNSRVKHNLKKQKRKKGTPPREPDKFLVWGRHGTEVTKEANMKKKRSVQKIKNTPLTLKNFREGREGTERKKKNLGTGIEGKTKKKRG